MDLDWLGRVIQTVVRHHEALRTRFCRLPGGFGAYTQVNPPHRLNVERVATEADALRRAQDYIDIVDPMFEVTVTPLANMRVQVPRTAELDLRSFPLAGSLRLALAYDGLDTTKRRPVTFSPMSATV